MFQEESQDIEYKESWKDEYLKWICGFANAHGGRIFIGINDEKEVVGIKNSKQLMEDIPNKIPRSPVISTLPMLFTKLVSSNRGDEALVSFKQASRMQGYLHLNMRLLWAVCLLSCQEDAKRQMRL